MDALRWLLVVLGAGVLLLAADRAVAAGLLHGRPRRPRSGGGGASGALGELVEIFQPSHEQVTLEQERRRLDTVQTPGTAPAVDLDAGVARLPAPSPPTSGAGAASDPARPDRDAAPSPPPSDEPGAPSRLRERDEP